MFLVKQYLMNEMGGDGAQGGGSAPEPSSNNSASEANPKQDTSNNQEANKNLAQDNNVSTQGENQNNQQSNANNQSFNSGLWDGEGEEHNNVNGDEQNHNQLTEQPYSHDEAYKDFEFKLKDGYSLTDEQKQGYLELAKEKGVKPEQMQTFIDKHIEANEKNLSDYRNTVAEWDNQVKNDPDLGGDNFPQTKKNVNFALSGKIDGGQEVRKLLADTGLISNPSVVKFLNNLGKMIPDGKVETGGQASNGNKTDYKSVYPNTNYDYK